MSELVQVAKTPRWGGRLIRVALLVLGLMSACSGQSPEPYSAATSVDVGESDVAADAASSQDTLVSKDSTSAASADSLTSEDTAARVDTAPAIDTSAPADVGVDVAPTPAPTVFKTAKFKLKETLAVTYAKGLTDANWGAKTGTTTELQLDMWEPQGTDGSLRPALIMIHGGGFKSGTRKNG
ncbi:MAG TPA: hypothetical protein DCQ06_08610, partial [Myxococcales bacterium]|nr:hypothetical protein [Myxococcales bacterium]